MRALRQPRPDALELPAGAPFAPDLHDARHLWLKAVLLLLWVLVSFVACFFARDLKMLLGVWQLGYWMAVQGAVLVFIAIVIVYCAAMSWFERQDARGAGGTPAARLSQGTATDRGHA